MLYKESFFKNIGRLFKAYPRTSKILGAGLLGGTTFAGGLGLSSILASGSKDAVARALVDFMIKAEPRRYSGFTEETRDDATKELVDKFNQSPVFFAKANQTYLGLKKLNKI